MEINISILIPRATSIAHLNLFQEQYEWDGCNYPQGLKKSKTFGSWLLYDSPLPDYLKDIIVKHVVEGDWRCLDIFLEESYQYMLNIDSIDECASHENPLVKILEATIDVAPTWIIGCVINDNPVESILYEDNDALKKNIVHLIEIEKSFVIFSQ